MLTCYGRGQHGYALIAVLWMTAALTVFVSALAYQARAEVRTAGMRRELAQAEASGDAAIQIAARMIAREPAQFAQKKEFTLVFDGEGIRVVVVPVSGLIALNAAPEPLLAALFAYGGGLDPMAAQRLAQRVMDWRDPDLAALPNGAENPEYQLAGSRFRTRGGPFEAPEDLLQVLGVTLETYDKIKDLVTVDSGSARCNPLAAPLEVLLVLARGDVAVAERIAGGRDAGNALVDTTSLMQEFVDQSTSSRFRIRAVVPVGEQRFSVRTQVVDVAPVSLHVPWISVRAERASGFAGSESIPTR